MKWFRRKQWDYHELCTDEEWKQLQPSTRENLLISPEFRALFAISRQQVKSQHKGSKRESN